MSDNPLDDLVAFDTETHLIQPGILAPELVCASLATATDARLLSADEARMEFRRLLESNKVIAGANIAYDMGVMAADDPDLIPLIFAKYQRGEVWDVQIAQALDAIAAGLLFKDPRTLGPLCDPHTGKQMNRYSLSICADLVLGRVDAKQNDFWRLRYAVLQHVPMKDWPWEARQYPVDDARNTWDIAAAQLGFMPRVGAPNEPKPLRNLSAQADQAFTAFCMHLGAAWGLRTDGERVSSLRERADKQYTEVMERLRSLDFLKHDKKADEWKINKAAVKRAAALAYGADPLGQCATCGGTGKVTSAKSGNPVICKGMEGCDGTGLDLSSAPALPRTPTGGVSADRDTLMESGDEVLHEMGENEIVKIRDTYLPFVEQGVNAPINLRPNVLVASFRTSYDGLIQLIPRSGGVRECFKARPGYVYCSVDFSALELCTLAQTCLWTVERSKMAEVINESKDPGALHTGFGAQMLGMTAEEMAHALKVLKDPKAKDFRQAAKAANFGFPGGMGEATLVLAKRKKAEGETVGPDGTRYSGIRFCILIGGADRCGLKKVTEYKGRPLPPTCAACIEAAAFLRSTWLKTWDEIPLYFEWVNAQVEYGGEVPCLYPPDSGLVRGGVDFTNGANHGFQYLAAVGAKNALRRLTAECYTDRESPLYGTRPIMFVHDEIFAEMPEEVAHLAGPRMAEVMVAAMREVVPDVHVAAEPALMRYWYKAAEPVYLDGKLVPWEPKED